MFTLRCKVSSHRSIFWAAGWASWSSGNLPSWSFWRWYQAAKSVQPYCCSKLIFSSCCCIWDGCLSTSGQRWCQSGIPERHNQEIFEFIYGCCCKIWRQFTPETRNITNAAVGERGRNEEQLHLLLKSIDFKDNGFQQHISVCYLLFITFASRSIYYFTSLLVHTIRTSHLALFTIVLTTKHLSVVFYAPFCTYKAASFLLTCILMAHFVMYSLAWNS